MVHSYSSAIITAVLQLLQGVHPATCNYGFAVLLLADALDAARQQDVHFECPAEAVVYMLAAQSSAGELLADPQWHTYADELVALLVHFDSAWQQVLGLAAAPHSRDQVGAAAAAGDVMHPARH